MEESMTLDKKTIIIIAILAFIIVILVSFLVVSKLTSNKDYEKEKIEEKDNEEKEDEIKEDDEVKADTTDYSTVSKELYALIEEFYRSGLSKNMNAYKMKVLYSSDMTNDLKMSMAINSLEVLNGQYESITNEELKSAYERIFRSTTYVASTFKNECSYCACPEEIKLVGSKYILTSETCGCGSSPSDHLIYDGYEVDGKYVNVKVRIAYISGDPLSKEIIYGDSERTKAIAYVEEKDDYIKYKDRLDLQTYSFIKDTSGYYVLYAIEL